jgi:MFS transporter, FHS family, glucose/mannose:H+ symporter
MLAFVALWILVTAISHGHESPNCGAPAPPSRIAGGQDNAAASDRPQLDTWAWWRTRGLVFAALFFLYVGIENSVGGWVATYARRLTSAPGARWELAPLLFWGTLILGRILAPPILRYVTEAKLVMGGLVMTALGVAVLLISKSLLSVFFGVSLAGLGLSSVFPITIALLTGSLGPAASRMAGPMFALAGLGGAALPWLVGFLSSQFGSLGVGLVVPLLATLIMAALESSPRANFSGIAIDRKVQ